MNYALFLGCNIPIRIKQYESSGRAVLEKLGIKLKDIPDFNCCGYPARNYDEKTFILSAGRNLAIAEKEGLDILVFCNCCFGSLKKAEQILRKDRWMLTELNQILAKDGLEYRGNTRIRHFLSIIYHAIGIEMLKQNLLKTYSNLNAAVIYGCHLLRPHEITDFDNRFAPSIFDKLVEATGARSVDWTGKFGCCGAALTGINDKLSTAILKEKIGAAKNSGADCIISACSFCYLQFDMMQQKIISENNESEILPAIVYPQLLGLCMGIDEKTLGIEKNETIKKGDTDNVPFLRNSFADKQSS